MASHTEENPFEKPLEGSDAVLLVEGKKLHVNKLILSNASPVFARMFKGDFKERKADEIPLPDKSYEEVLQMLRCIYPSVLDDVTMENVDGLLDLANEYQISALKMKCERAVLSAIINFKMDSRFVVHAMYLGQQFDLDKLLKVSMDTASHMTYLRGIRSEAEYKCLSFENKARYLAKRVYRLETTFLLKPWECRSGCLEDD